MIFFFIFMIIHVNGQTFDSNYLFKFGPNTMPWPNPSDPNHRTYTLNDRRYGYHQPSDANGNTLNTIPVGIPGGDDYRYNKNAQVPLQFPGILAGWREDLQGKKRQDSLALERDVSVNTNYGQVQGFKVYMYDNPDPKSFYRPYHSTVDRVTGECSVFLGIPYAMPPTVDGRFKPPRPNRGWQIMRAVDFGPACPQPARYTGDTKGVLDVDEDCLYLNIFSPKTGAGIAQKYPVMIYIHGGDFIHGASNLFPGHVLASFYDVVIVTLNYRLGALGFLSTGDENSPGNYGILDQAMALRWVYDNIDSFNGDRDSITLFGPGAGAASAGLLMVAPQTKNMVKRVIAQSGSALADWALIKDKYRAQNTSRIFGQLMGCNIESSWKLVNCLRTGRTFYEIGNAEFSPHVGTFPWGPVLDVNFTFPGDDWYEGWREKDWKFISKSPEELIRDGSFHRDLQYMTGVTTQEAAFFLSKNESLAPFYEIDKTFVDQKISEHVLQYNYTLNPKGVYEAIKYMYTYWPDPNNTTIIRDQYVSMLSDYFYRAPVDQIVKLLVERQVPVYIYVLNTTVEALNLPLWRRFPHDIEHYFLTGAPFMDVEFFPKKSRLKRDQWTDNDRNMSHFFLKTYSNFARYGNPTPKQVLGLHFEKAYQGELRYLNINTTFNSSILLNYRQTEFAFWIQYLPTVIGVLLPTYPPYTEAWWEPREPLQIAFWSLSIACFFLLVLVVICCIMWRNAKRQSERFFADHLFIKSGETDIDCNSRHEGIDNFQMMESPSELHQESTASSKLILYKGRGDDNSKKYLRPPGFMEKSTSQSSLKTPSLNETNISVSAPYTNASQKESQQHIIANDLIKNSIQMPSSEKKSQQNSLKSPPFVSEKDSLSKLLPIAVDPFGHKEYKPTANTNLRENYSDAITEVVEGVPQTTV